MPVIAEHLKIYLSGPVSYREFRETGPWPQLFKGHRIDCYLTDKMYWLPEYINFYLLGSDLYTG